MKMKKEEEEEEKEEKKRKKKQRMQEEEDEGEETALQPCSDSDRSSTALLQESSIICGSSPKWSWLRCPQQQSSQGRIISFSLGLV